MQASQWGTASPPWAVHAQARELCCLSRSAGTLWWHLWKSDGSKGCLWISCHSNGKTFLLSESEGKIAQAELSHESLCTENPKDIKAVTQNHQRQVGKPVLRLLDNMAGFDGRIWVSLSIYSTKCLHLQIQVVCLCSFSCECFSVLCFVFTLFLSLYCTNPEQCPVFFCEGSLVITVKISQ